MNYKKRAVTGTITVFIILIIAAFIAYLFRMILARNLTTSEYGLFFAVLTLINLVILFARLGLNNSLVKFIPEFVVKKSPEKIKNIVAAVFSINLITAIIIAVIIFFLADFLSVVYFKDPLASILLKIFSIVFVLIIFRDNLRSFFRAFHKMFIFSFVRFLENTLLVVFVLILFKFNFKLLSPAFSYLLVNILLVIIFLPIALKIFPYFKYPTKLSKSLIKRVFSFGTPMLLLGIGSTVILYFDTLLLTYFKPLADVGIYNAVVPTVMLLAFFNRSVVTVIFPTISELWALKKTESLRKGIMLIQKYSFVVIIPFALIMFSFPTLLLKILFGSGFIQGAEALQILVIGIIFFVVASIHLNIISALGKPKIGAKVMLIGAVFNILTNLYFIPKWGIIGAAITSLLSYILIYVLSAIYLSKFIKLRTPWSNWLKIFSAGLAFVFLIWLLKSLINLNVFLEAAICIIISGLAYFGILWLMKSINIKEIKSFFR